MRILIAGVTRSLGRVVADHLLNQPDVEAVIGVDARACYPPITGLHFVRADVRRPEWAAWLDGVDAAVHVEAAAWPLRRAHCAHEAALLSRVRAFVEAVRLARVPKLIVLNSAALYGVVPGHGASMARLDETAPVRGHSASAFARTRAQLADYLDNWQVRYPVGGPLVTRLRTGWIAGPHHSLLGTLWGGPLAACGYELRRMPVVHEADVAAAVRLAVQRDLPGIYHVAADDGLSFRELAALVGQDTPCRPLSWLVVWAWLRWRWFGARTPPGWFQALYRGAALATDRLQAAGWAARYPARAVAAAAVEASLTEQ